MNKYLLDIYTDFLICSTSYTTATALSRATDGAISHDQVTRFLSSEDFTSADFWQMAKPLARSMEDDDGVLIVDDSIEEKPYTDENDIIAWHYDHSKGRSVKGINFITALYQTAKGSIKKSVPIAYELVRKTVQVVKTKTNKKRPCCAEKCAQLDEGSKPDVQIKSRKSPVSKQQYFRNLVKAAITNNVKFKTVLADVWFSSAENMCYVKIDMKKDFILPIKDNRKVALSKEELAAGKFVGIKKLELGESVLVWLEDVDFPLRLVRQVFKNEDGSTGVLHLVSSNIELTDEQITTTYHRRWSVEVFHESLKNNALLAKSPTRTERTQANHLFASMCAFIRLEGLSIASKLNQFALKKKLYIEATKAAFRELEKIKNEILQIAKRQPAPA